jgi:hypothetical protein
MATLPASLRSASDHQTTYVHYLQPTKLAIIAEHYTRAASIAYQVARPDASNPALYRRSILLSFKCIHERSLLLPGHRSKAEEILSVYDRLAAAQ